MFIVILCVVITVVIKFRVGRLTTSFQAKMAPQVVASAAFHSLFLCVNRIKRALNLNTYQTTNMFKLLKNNMYLYYFLLLIDF